MQNKNQSIIAILAALLVLFSAMFNPVVSMVIAVASLLGLAIYSLIKK